MFVWAILSIPKANIGQSYITALGVRTGKFFGLTLQQKIVNSITAELIYVPSTRYYEEEYYALIRKHKRILSKSFNVYAGAGLHMINKNHRFNSNPLGIVTQVGVELNIWRLNTSFDFLPSIFIRNSEYLLDHSSSLSIRYIILKSKKKKFLKWKL